MDHAYIEEHGLVERYHRGDLPAEEEARFEEHFTGCVECQEQLVLARSFRKGIRALAAEETARRAVVVRAGLLAWLARRGHTVQVSLLAAVLLAAIVPLAWLFNENRELSHRLAGQRGVDPSLLLLSAHRGAPGEPAAVLDLGKAGQGPVVLAFDAGGDPRFESFRVTIVDEHGSAVFVREGLRPNALEVVMVSFPAEFFAPGDYRLTVTGMTGAGLSFELDSYPFRVLAAP